MDHLDKGNNTTCEMSKVLDNIKNVDSNSSNVLKESAELSIKFSPKPQRKARINRRSYFLENKCISLSSFKEIASQNGCGRSCDDKSKTECTSKNTITFNKTNCSTINALCNSSDKKKDSLSHTTLRKKSIIHDIDKKDTIDCDVSSSNDSPPKKKYKPITWP